MSNTLPVNVADLLKQELANLNKMTASTGSTKVDCKGKGFSLPGDKDTTIKYPMKAVVLDFGSYNAYYDKPFDKNAEPEAPPCYAYGKFVQQLTPSAAAKNPQAENCSVCPLNQFGSKGAGKACGNKRILAAVVLNGPEAFDPQTAKIFRIDVSATGIKHWDKYVKDVQHTFGVPPVGVITDISSADEVDYVSLRFSNPTPNPHLEALMGRKSEAASMLEQDPHNR